MCAPCEILLRHAAVMQEDSVTRKTMLTIPLTPIEGAMAFPTPCRFRNLPASFGGEWAPLPPNISFRAELKAPYAALLRTFCLSADEMRSMCRWEPRHPKTNQSVDGMPMPRSLPFLLRQRQRNA
jgi:hypothetical protein